MASEAQRRAVKRYDAAHTVGLYLKLNTTTDADIIERLEEVAKENPIAGKQGYIKRLIREDMEAQK